MLALAFVAPVVFLGVFYPGAEFRNSDMLAAQNILQLLHLFLQDLHVVDVEFREGDTQSGVAGVQEFCLFAGDEFVDIPSDDVELALDGGQVFCLEGFGNVLDSENLHVLDEFVDALVAEIFRLGEFFIILLQIFDGINVGLNKGLGQQLGRRRRKRKFLFCLYTVITMCRRALRQLDPLSLHVI